MNLLKIILYGNCDVFTTTQIAECYGTYNDHISKIFSENNYRSQVYKHYIKLEGNELLYFRKSEPQLQISNLARVLYLWTEKGAWHHAKSLNTDKAWEAYEMLIDEYYTVKEKVVPLDKNQALVPVLLTTADLVEDTKAIKYEQHEIRKELSMINEKVEEQITLTSGEQRAVQKEVAIKIYEIENDTTVRPKLFRELHREIKNRFAVASYKDIRRQDLQMVLNFIRSWFPRKVS
ncbi:MULTISPECIES: ORF6N domain-containing protein [unclassified Lysinibacillus]|uniref:ORF6N domain-containing protein n=1 Tax=unclassified Lysinibacillus TaxID=2636778 RepID=UPI00382CC3CA